MHKDFQETPGNHKEASSSYQRGAPSLGGLFQFVFCEQLHKCMYVHGEHYANFLFIGQLYF